MNNAVPVGIAAATTAIVFHYWFGDFALATIAALLVGMLAHSSVKEN